MKLICTDVETGGLDPSRHSLLSVAFCVVDTEARTISDEFELFIKEDPLILMEAAIKVNGISLNEIYEKGIPPKEASQKVCDYLSSVGGAKSVILLGHNVHFDRSFLTQRLEGAAQYISHRVVDTSSVARFLFHAGILQKDLSSGSNLFDFFGLPKEGRHSALVDCQNTARAYLGLIYLVELHESL
jgi:DNA polymerase III epsilon subunit-like protein